MAPSMYKTGFHKQTWSKKLFSQRLPEKIGASKYEIFSLIFEEVITHLVTETDRYAQQKMIMIFMWLGKRLTNLLEFYSCQVTTLRQNIRDYWSKNDLLECKPFVECIAEIDSNLSSQCCIVVKTNHWE